MDIYAMRNAVKERMRKLASERRLSVSFPCKGKLYRVKIVQEDLFDAEGNAAGFGLGIGKSGAEKTASTRKRSSARRPTRKEVEEAGEWQ